MVALHAAVCSCSGPLRSERLFLGAVLDLGGDRRRALLHGLWRSCTLSPMIAALGRLEVCSVSVLASTPANINVHHPKSQAAARVSDTGPTSGQSPCPAYSSALRASDHCARADVVAANALIRACGWTWRRPWRTAERKLFSYCTATAAHLCSHGTTRAEGIEENVRSAPVKSATAAQFTPCITRTKKDRSCAYAHSHARQ